MNKTIVNDIGWLGVVLILLAYLLNSLGTLNAADDSYLLLNIIGSIFLAYESFKKKDRQPVALNIIWALIAVVALFRHWL